MRIRACASIAAMGVPTMPGPTTAILRTHHCALPSGEKLNGMLSLRFQENVSDDG
jgi:hypothetical protein